MSDFSINITDKNNYIAVISGKDDDPDQWFRHEDTFFNENIVDVSLEISFNSVKLQYIYTIRNINNLSITIVDSNNNTILDKISVLYFINNIAKYECMKSYTYDNNINSYYIEIGNTKIIFEIVKLIGFKSCKTVLKISM